MLTSYLDITNFSARNITIREADNLARTIAKSFQYPSTSKTAINKNISLQKKDQLLKQTVNFRTALDNKLKYTFGTFNKIDTIIKAIKENCIVNCLEFSFLASLYAKCSGIKNYDIKSLSTLTKELDHGVLYVQNGNKPYVIDPWLGFADYVPKAIERYNSEFRNFLDFDNSSYKNIIFMDIPHNYNIIGTAYEFKHKYLSKNLLKQLRIHYPELLANYTPEKNKNVFKILADIVLTRFQKENFWF